MDNKLKKSASVIGDVFELLLGKNFKQPLDNEMKKYLILDTYIDINKNSL
jgi:hypothetical protein